MSIWNVFLIIYILINITTGLLLIGGSFIENKTQQGQ